MKVDDSVSFGKTFVQPSIRYLSKINQSKIEHSYGLGQIYPMDVSLGGTTLGDLTVSIRRGNLWDFYTANDEIPLTNENILMYYLAKRFEVIGEFLHGSKYPIERHIIKNLNKKTRKEIAFEINDIIADYNKKYGKQFMS